MNYWILQTELDNISFKNWYMWDTSITPSLQYEIEVIIKNLENIWCYT